MAVHRVEVNPGDSVVVASLAVAPAKYTAPRSVVGSGYVRSRVDYNQSYFVYLFSDGSNACQCQDWFFNVNGSGRKSACYHVEQLRKRS